MTIVFYALYHVHVIHIVIKLEVYRHLLSICRTWTFQLSTEEQM